MKKFIALAALITCFSHSNESEIKKNILWIITAHYPENVMIHNYLLRKMISDDCQTYAKIFQKDPTISNNIFCDWNEECKEEVTLYTHNIFADHQARNKLVYTLIDSKKKNVIGSFVFAKTSISYEVELHGWLTKAYRNKRHASDWLKTLEAIITANKPRIRFKAITHQSNAPCNQLLKNHDFMLDKIITRNNKNYNVYYKSTPLEKSNL